MGFTYLDETVHFIEWAGWSDADAPGTNNASGLELTSERRIDSILCRSTDSVVQVVRFELVVPSVGWIDGWDIRIPIGAGVTAPLFEGLPDLLKGLQGGLILPAGYKWQANNLTSGSAGKEFSIKVLGGQK